MKGGRRNLWSCEHQKRFTLHCPRAFLHEQHLHGALTSPSCRQCDVIPLWFVVRLPRVKMHCHLLSPFISCDPTSYKMRKPSVEPASSLSDDRVRSKCRFICSLILPRKRAIHSKVLARLL